MMPSPARHRVFNRRDALSTIGLAALGVPAIALAPAAWAHHSATASPDREMVLGAADAPITMIEYSSLTCPHCAKFHVETLPAIKTNYIDSGKARLVYRDFPLNKAALQAAALAHCAGPDRYFQFLDVLFRSQQSWAMTDDPVSALVRIGRMGGLKGDQIEACLNDKALIDRILASRVEGARDFDVASTPTFIINGENLVGALPYEQFEEVFERLL